VADNKNLMISISGIRGEIPEGLNTKNITLFSLAYAEIILESLSRKLNKENVNRNKFIDSKKIKGKIFGEINKQDRIKIILACDTRPSSPFIIKIVTGTLMI